MCSVIIAIFIHSFKKNNLLHQKLYVSLLLIPIFTSQININYSLARNIGTISRIELIDKANRNLAVESIKIDGLEDPELQKYVPNDLLTKLVEEVEMVKTLLPKLDKKLWNRNPLLLHSPPSVKKAFKCQYTPVI